MKAKRRCIQLHNNESYWLVDKKLADAYRTHDPSDFSKYPVYDELRKAIAVYAGVRPEHIVITPGSDSAIRALAELSTQEGKRALLPVPTFYGYERIIAAAGLRCETVCYREKHGAFIFPLKETERRLRTGKTDILFLCQPNNPLGSEIPRDTLNTLLDIAKKTDTLVVSDEAYFEFSGVTAMKRFARQRIIIMRTFSKGFGLCGARVGYLVAPKPLAEQLNKRLLPWPVARPSVHAALQALKLRRYATKRAQLVIAERDRFTVALATLPGVRVYPSATNFLLIRLPNAEKVANTLEKKGIAVACPYRLAADRNAQKLLASTLRLATPSPKDSKAVLRALENALSKRGK